MFVINELRYLFHSFNGRRGRFIINWKSLTEKHNKLNREKKSRIMIYVIYKCTDQIICSHSFQNETIAFWFIGGWWCCEMKLSLRRDQRSDNSSRGALISEAHHADYKSVRNFYRCLMYSTYNQHIMLKIT